MIKKRLQDIALNITDGKHGDCEGAENSGFYFISCKDVHDGAIHYDGARQITEKDFLDTHKRTMLEPNDILVTNSGTIGRMALVKDVPTTYKTTFQKSVAIIKPNQEIIRPAYLYYCLLNCVNQFINQSKGSAQKNLLLGTMRNFEIEYEEEFDKQDKIINILQTYDSLIENNRKQIKLLEEAAQRLYKEWFVDLRFPGYEGMEIVDGVPEGWKRTTIGEFLGIRSGYAFKSGWWQDSGYPVVKIKDINNNTIDISSLDHVAPEHTSKIPEFKLDKGDIVIAMTGATIGKIGLVPEVDNLYTNQRVGKVFPNAELLIPTPFVFCFYGQKSILEQIIALSSSSSAQPNISGGQLESFEVIANIDIINKFGKNMQPHFDKINDLYKQNRLLTQARDRLLPKLMNGEIEV